MATSSVNSTGTYETQSAHNPRSDYKTSSRVLFWGLAAAVIAVAAIIYAMTRPNYVGTSVGSQPVSTAPVQNTERAARDTTIGTSVERSATTPSTVDTTSTLNRNADTGETNANAVGATSQSGAVDTNMSNAAAASSTGNARTGTNESPRGTDRNADRAPAANP